MNINQKAIEYLESNEYDKALELFKEAVNESRNIQSLNNLAWIYLHEECDEDAALDLLREAIEMNPTSHFPYNILGEIYIMKEMWSQAAEALDQSLKIYPSCGAYKNLAVACYHLGRLEDASRLFLQCSENSDYSMYSHVKCLIELGEREEAKRKLDAFCEEDEEFVGTAEVAELYLELECYKESVYWFEKAWTQYWKSPDWLSRFVYALLKYGNEVRAHAILEEVIHLKCEEAVEAHQDECNEGWTNGEKAEYIKQINEDKSEYEGMYEKISSGYIPSMNFNTSMNSSCYLFGCNRHQHSECGNLPLS